jgi:homogentisate 1,2-dioxygenase
MRASWFHLARGTYARNARMGLGELGVREEHLSRVGFVGSVAMLYHRHGPTEFVSADPRLGLGSVAVRSFRTPDADDPDGHPLVLYANDDVTVSWSQRAAASTTPLRNLDGDLLHFVHEGDGLLETEFGTLSYAEGDFLFVPKAVTHRFVPSTASHMLVIESATPIEPFDIDAAGRHAPFDPSVIEVPEPCPRDDSGPGEFEVTYKLRGEYPTATLRYDPFDVVGWKGDLFPFRLAIADILPIQSERAHLAPSIGGVFRGEGFIVSNLLPQAAVADLDSEEMPSYHRNIDYDEFWLIHRSGMERRGNGELMHIPQGFVHGASEEIRDQHQAARRADARRDVTAVGVEAWRPLVASNEYRAVLDSREG